MMVVTHCAVVLLTCLIVVKRIILLQNEDQLLTCEIDIFLQVCQLYTYYNSSFSDVSTF